MPPLISSSSNNQEKKLGFTISNSSNNYRNRGLSVFPRFINGGTDQPLMNNGVSSNCSNKCLSVVPGSFNGIDQQVMNLTHSNQTNRSLSVGPGSFNGSDQQVMNLTHSNQTNRSLSVVPSSFNGDYQQVINGVSLNYSNGIQRGLSLAPSFNDYERVINNGIISYNYSFSNQQEFAFSVSSSDIHRNRSTSLAPNFSNYEQIMDTGVYSSYSNQKKLGFYVSRNNHINRSLSLVPSFIGHERVMNNGTSPNYSNRLELGFPVSGRNHQNRSLSAVNVIGRRIHVRNYHFYYSARLVAMREILRARLISAFSSRRRMVINTRSGTSFISQIKLNNSSQPRRTRLTITELDEETCSDHNQTSCNDDDDDGALASTPVSVHYPSTANNENDVENIDGITHSLPYKKYGPYTCPRCFGKFPTSQTFAAHVSSHYKYETKAQRKRRLMAKIRRRHLRLHHSREGITLLPTEPVARPEPTDMSGAEAKGDGVLSLVQIKEEPADL